MTPFQTNSSGKGSHCRMSRIETIPLLSKVKMLIENRKSSFRFYNWELDLFLWQL